MAREFVAANSQAAHAAIDLSAYNKISVSMWVYIYSSQPNAFAFACELSENAPSGGHGFYIRPVDASGSCVVLMAASGVFQFSLFPAPSRDSWHHLVATLDMTTATIQFYIDKVLQTASSTGGTPITTGSFTTDNFYFASEAANSSFLYCDMAFVALYAGILNQTQINSLYTTPPGYVNAGNLIDCWNFAGTTSPEPDSKGANDATLVNAPSQSADPPGVNPPPSVSPATARYYYETIGGGVA